MKLKILNLEALIWILGLVYLFFVDTNSHYSFCIFKNLGIDFCPGCGLGRSIHYLMHFEIVKSVNTHPLGIFAFVVLVNRIFILSFPEFTSKKILLNLKRLVRSK
jgi:hypothetical protein